MSLTLPSDMHLEWMQSITSSYARRHPTIDPADITQHLWEKWLDKNDSVAKYVHDEEDERGKAKLLSTLSRWAAEFCHTEEAAQRGYRYEDLAFYSRKHLRNLLPLLGEPYTWTSYAVKADDPSGRTVVKPESERGDDLAVLADLRAAWSKLTETERNVLRVRFVDSGVGDPLTVDDEQAVREAHYVLMDEYGLSLDAVKKRVQRAVRRLQGYLGGDRVLDVSYIRRPSNARAQVIARKDWSGE